jgi:hypothetical protein
VKIGLAHTRWQPRYTIDVRFKALSMAVVMILGDKFQNAARKRERSELRAGDKGLMRRFKMFK